MPNFFDGRHTQDYARVEDATQKYISEMEEFFEKLSASGRRVAAHISEPYHTIQGLYIPQKTYIQALYRCVRRHGGVVIADEVQTGLGRTGENFWSFQNLGVVPDIVTVSTSACHGILFFLLTISRLVFLPFRSESPWETVIPSGP